HLSIRSSIIYELRIYIITYLQHTNPIIYTLPLHDALPIYDIPNTVARACDAATRLGVWMLNVHASGGRAMLTAAQAAVRAAALRSEEHTSELQSRRDLVCRLLLVKQ